MGISKIIYSNYEVNAQVVRVRVQKIAGRTTEVFYSCISNVKNFSFLSLLSPFCSISLNGASYGSDGTYAMAKNGIAITMSAKQLTVVGVLALAIIYAVSAKTPRK